MKLFSIPSLLLAAIVLALAANILFRLPNGFGGKSVLALGKNETWGAANVMPNASNLRAMGNQWKERLATLPPEERKKSEARLKEETKYFMELQLLPTDERKQKTRERIEALMNDPEIQADWAGERMKILAGLTPEQRHEILKKYVRAKKNCSP